MLVAVLCRAITDATRGNISAKERRSARAWLFAYQSEGKPDPFTFQWTLEHLTQIPDPDGMADLIRKAVRAPNAERVFSQLFTSPPGLGRGRKNK